MKKQILLAALGALALAGNLKADVVEYHGLFISSEDAVRLGLKASPVPELTVNSDGRVVEVSAEAKARQEWEGNVVRGGRAIEMAFDLNRRPTEIAEVLKSAGYDCTPVEIDTLRHFIKDYSWQQVIRTFRDSELALRHFRMTSDGSAAEIDQQAKSLFQGVAEAAANPVEPFIYKLVLKRHGLAN